MNRQEAINIVKKNWPDSSFTLLKEALEFLIPELMNTDDEKIKEAIIKGITHAAEEGCFCADNYSVKECVAWLEKQGEHANFRNKIQIGDKVTRNEDGVLVNLSQLKRVAKKDEKQDEQKPNFCHHEVDLSGYSDEYCKAYYDGWNNCNQQHAQLEAEKKPTEWSEEDETILKILNELVNTTPSKDFFDATKEKCIFWLKSLKDRVHPKQEWSEEDKKILERVINDIKSLKQQVYCKSACDEEIDWLKSLNSQSHWKPSDEQMNALNDVISSRDIKYDVLSELWKDLKKLKG